LRAPSKGPDVKEEAGGESDEQSRIHGDAVYSSRTRLEPRATLCFHHALSRTRILGQLLLRSPRARDKLASTVGAATAENLVRARATERAFE
jgi:hypothetical protein